MLELVTPPVDGVILPGVVRQSLLDLAQTWVSCGGSGWGGALLSRGPVWQGLWGRGWGTPPGHTAVALPPSLQASVSSWGV